jgi:peptidoglycan/xylan/chitin deacetylase (PgdA/CDA1 family)
MYHRIGDPPPDWPWPGLYVTRDEFARQLDELERTGYVAVTQRDLYDGWHAVRELPAKPLTVSFDDGHVSVWREAFPLMHARGWPAVLNLYVSMLDRDEGVSSEMVSELLRSGWELGAHSRTHPDLTQLDTKRLASEVAGARNDLAECFSVCPDFFCYPSGQFSAEIVNAVVRAGYLGATTTIPGLASPADLYAMARVRVSRGDSGARLARHLEELDKEWRAVRRETPA